MNVFDKIGVPGLNSVDWEITPELTFTMFESWGSKLWIRSMEERFYYFFIDNWQEPAKLCLMERGLKFARVVAEIDAPQELVDRCVKEQGKKIGLDRSFAINKEIKQWLLDEVLNANDASRVTPIKSGLDVEDTASHLPLAQKHNATIEVTTLRSAPIEIVEEDLPDIIKGHNFFDIRRNPEGRFNNDLVDNGDNQTVTDLATGLMWQRYGFDLTSIRNMNRKVEEVNNKAMGGFDNWRLPTAEEALSLLETEANDKGLFLHPCFSKAQPFIFLADQRHPGGYWFADFKQGTLYWASGTNPGGFGRFCRTV